MKFSPHGRTPGWHQQTTHPNRRGQSRSIRHLGRWDVRRWERNDVLNSLRFIWRRCRESWRCRAWKQISTTDSISTNASTSLTRSYLASCWFPVYSTRSDITNLIRCVRLQATITSTIWSLTVWSTTTACFNVDYLRLMTLILKRLNRSSASLNRVRLRCRLNRDTRTRRRTIQWNGDKNEKTTFTSTMPKAKCNITLHICIRWSLCNCLF